MIKQYNYSNLIKKSDEDNVTNLINYLFKKGIWCKTVPKYQTWDNLYEYEQLTIFKNTFLNSCFNYLNYLNLDLNKKYDITMWCFRDNFFTNVLKDRQKSWHNHGFVGENKISGVYYLKNFEKNGTEFRDFNLKYEPHTWFIFPSYLEHRPPKVKSLRYRCTIAADFHY